MSSNRLFRLILGLPALLFMAAGAHAAAGPAPRPLIDFAAEGAEQRVTVSDAGEVSFAPAVGAKGIVVTCKPGKGAYPGITIVPDGAPWDLSAFGHVDAQVANTGSERMAVTLRVDNDGDWKEDPWNAEHTILEPGQAGVVRVRFGYSWGKPGYALKPEKVVRLLLFIGKPKTEQSFRVESVVAGGEPGEKPPVRPEDIRVRPKDGVLLGKGSQVDAATQLDRRGGQAEIAAGDGGQTLRVTLPAGAGDASVRLKPAVGRWDLRDFLQVVVRARNAGRSPVALKARLDSSGGPSDWVSAPAAMAPGAAQEVTLPFAGGLTVLATAGQPKGGTRFESDRADGVTITAAGEGERVLVVESIRAVVPPPPALPEWLGKRPPVPGDWKQTLAEEFDGKAIDETRWSIYHPNYWDKRSHFSKENVIVGGGVVKLRFEKKYGHADDDPGKPATEWATGFLTGLGKWKQRYGYFECRMKLPKAPGLWPAFWMMPDRGPDTGAKRRSTFDGGMEVDILEYLTRYGPYRYNVAFHWDGYGKEHRSIGTERLYVQPDKEGFITAGFLWEPGRATFYAQGTAIARWEDPRVGNVPQYIKFTAVSGGWGGNDLTGEGLPDDFVIDYVRAWQRRDWAEPKTP